MSSKETKRMRLVARRFVGSTEVEARALADELNVTVRCHHHENRNEYLTADYNPRRVTATVEDGVITGASAPG